MGYSKDMLWYFFFTSYWSYPNIKTISTLYQKTNQYYDIKYMITFLFFKKKYYFVLESMFSCNDTYILQP